MSARRAKEDKPFPLPAVPMRQVVQDKGERYGL